MTRKIKRIDKYYVYIVQCNNDTYYTGYTNNIKNRIDLHNKGWGAKYLRGKGPVKLVYVKKYKYYKCALNAEKDIKKLSRAKKDELVNDICQKKNLRAYL